MGCGGCNPLEDIKILKLHLIQETIHFNVFIPIHRSFDFSDIFLEGVSRPQRLPLNPPLYDMHTVTCKAMLVPLIVMV